MPPSVKAMSIVLQMQRLLLLMSQVYEMTYRREIKGEVVPNDQKIFSIYEQHTDIIVKGQREVKFGHKVNVGTGKSNLILTCEVLQGNPADTGLFQKTIDKLLEQYNITSSKNMETRLKKWRSGIEANISNLLRGFDLSVCNWKGWEHFKSKILFSVIAYNIRVMTAALIKQL